MAALRVLLAFLQRRARLPGVRAVLAHWVAERRTIRQGILALALSTGVGMGTGLVLGAMEATIARVPGLLVLVPAAIGLRGAIFGALGARLGTGILTGEYQPRLRRGAFAGANVEAAVLLSVVSAALAALLASGTAAVFGLASIDLWGLAVVSVIGGALSSAFVLAGVLALARSAAQRDWDLDAIGSPLITAVGDLVTLPALVAGTLLLALARPGLIVLGAACLLAGVACAVLGLRSTAGRARRIVGESLPVLAYAALVTVLAGAALETRVDAFLGSPALLVLVPPFLASCGSLGGILAARLASDLHLGLVTPRLLPERRALLDGSIMVLFATLAFSGTGLIGHTAAAIAGFRSPGLGRMVAVALLGGLLTIGLLFVVAYATAAATFRFGLDPDNTGIPVVTATMDLLGVLCLVAAIAILGVSP